MSNETILISEVIPTTPQRIFSAWLDSAEHSSFTGSQAALLPFVGGEYSAWDGYVQGRTLELNDGARIVQSWRTTEFPADSPDSRLEITLEATLGGTLLTLLHTDIPSGQSDRVRQGWYDYYLSRMKSYFGDTTASTDEHDFTAADDLLVGDGVASAGDGVSPLAGFDAADALIWEDAIPSHLESTNPAPQAPTKPAPQATTKPAPKATTKPAAQATMKPAQPAAQKPAKKQKMKAAAKKGAMKAAMKAAMKGAMKAAMKGAKKGAKKVAKKLAMKVAKKVAKKPAKKMAKAAAKKPASKAKRPKARAKATPTAKKKSKPASRKRR